MILHFNLLIHFIDGIQLSFKFNFRHFGFTGFHFRLTLYPIYVNKYRPLQIHSGAAKSQSYVLIKNRKIVKNTHVFILLGDENCSDLLLSNLLKMIPILVLLITFLSESGENFQTLLVLSPIRTPFINLDSRSLLIMIPASC